MKRIVLLFMMVAVCAVSYGQKKEKPPKVAKAKLALENGELAEAKTIIDLAIEHEKTKEKIDTWYYHAEIYSTIANSDDPIVPPIEALVLSGESFRKVAEMAGPTNPTVLLSDQKYNSLYGGWLNQAYEYSKTDDFESALGEYQKAQAFKPADTIAFLYGAIAAQQLENNDLALELYQKTIDKGSQDVSLYYRMIYIERGINEDLDGALKIANEASTKFPDNTDLSKEVINLLILTDRMDEAKPKLKAAIENEPENGAYYFNLGYLYEKEGSRDDAIATYKQGTEMSPEYVDNYVNLSVILYNEYAELINEANSMDLKTYDKEGKPLVEKGKKVLDEAVNYIEKAYEIKPDDQVVLSNLYNIYSGLKRKDEAQAIYEKLEAMGFFDEE